MTLHLSAFVDFVNIFIGYKSKKKKKKKVKATHLVTLTDGHCACSMFFFQRSNSYGIKLSIHFTDVS